MTIIDGDNNNEDDNIDDDDDNHDADDDDGFLGVDKKFVYSNDEKNSPLVIVLNGIDDDLLSGDLIEERILGIDRQKVFEPGVEAHRRRKHLEEALVVIHVVFRHG